MKFEELDDETRKWMLIEFEEEESSKNPYRSSHLNSTGKEKFREIMKNAISSGNILSLTNTLSNLTLWKKTGLVTTKGTVRERRISPSSSAKSLAHTEFTTWYTRGFAKRLMEEGIDSCEIYRAEVTKNPRCECTKLEGHTVKVKAIYDGHRAKYHPTINSSAFSIPSGPFCHHTIRRLK